MLSLFDQSADVNFRDATGDVLVIICCIVFPGFMPLGVGAGAGVYAGVIIGASLCVWVLVRVRV